MKSVAVKLIVHVVSPVDGTAPHRAPYPVTPALGQVSTTDPVYYAWPAGEMTRDILLTQQRGRILDAACETGAETTLGVLAQPGNARLRLRRFACLRLLKSRVTQLTDVDLEVCEVMTFLHLIRPSPIIALTRDICSCVWRARVSSLRIPLYVSVA